MVKAKIREEVRKDCFTIDKRSQIMKRIRSQGTKPEIQLYALLSELKLSFHSQCSDVVGTPDAILNGCEVAIFVNGCFWHGHRGCKRATLPQSSKSFWSKKIHENRLRDARVDRWLRRNGWSVARLWTCHPLTKQSLIKKLLSLTAVRRSPMGRRLRKLQ